MYTNERFHLSDQQLQQLTEWTNERCKSYWQDGYGDSFQFDVTFSFSYFGRSVIATVDGEHLGLEDEMGDCLPPVKEHP